MKNTLKGQTMNTNIFERGGRLYIDCQNGGERVRFSTGLKAGAENKVFVKKHYALFLKDKSEALSKHKAFVDALFDKQNTAKAPKRAKNSEFDIQNLLQKLLIEKSFLRIYTRKNNEHSAKALLNFFNSVGICDIRHVKREHCVAYAKFLQERSLKKGSIKNKMVTLNQLLRFALDNGLIDKNPYFLPKMSVGENDTPISPFSLDEVQSLIKAASGELKSYLIVAFFTGARTGELLGLKYSDIDFEKGEITIERTKHPNGTLGIPKTRSSKRVIDMLAPVKNELLNQKNDEFIFKSSRAVIKKHFKELCTALKLPKHRLYDTRHTFASIMLSRGEEPMWVGVKMLGHKDLNMTFKVYAKYMPKSVSCRAKFLDELDLGVNEPNLFEHLA